MKFLLLLFILPLTFSIPFPPNNWVDETNFGNGIICSLETCNSCGDLWDVNNTEYFCFPGATNLDLNGYVKSKFSIYTDEKLILIFDAIKFGADYDQDTRVNLYLNNKMVWSSDDMKSYILTRYSIKLLPMNTNIEIKFDYKSNVSETTSPTIGMKNFNIKCCK